MRLLEQEGVVLKFMFKFMKYLLLSLLSILLIVVVYFVAVLFWPRPLPPERICELQASSIVQLGQTSFRIPSSMRGAYIKDNGPLIGNIERRARHLTKICPTYPDEVFSRTHLSIEAPKPNLLTELHMPFSANIRFDVEEESSKEFFETGKITTEMKDATLNGYHSNKSLYVGTLSVWSTTNYLTTDLTFLTPRGNPMVFHCYFGSRTRGRECFTVVVLNDEVRMSYTFFDKEYPMEEWKVLHYQVMDFVESIMINITPEID